MFYLVKLVKNNKGQYAPTITSKEDLTSAIVLYHSTLASLHNASDVAIATVEIIGENGSIVTNYKETVNHETASTNDANV